MDSSSSFFSRVHTLSHSSRAYFGKFVSIKMVYPTLEDLQITELLSFKTKN